MSAESFYTEIGVSKGFAEAVLTGIILWGQNRCGYFAVFGNLFFNEKEYDIDIGWENPPLIPHHSPPLVW